MRRRLFCLVVMAIGIVGTRPAVAAQAAPSSSFMRATWPETMQAARTEVATAAAAEQEALAERASREIATAFPQPVDWMQQDAQARLKSWLLASAATEIEQSLLHAVERELSVGHGLRDEITALCHDNPRGDDRRWLDLYERACQARRRQRLALLERTAPEIVFLKHHNLAGSHYAYTEAQSDAQAERNYRPGAALCLLQLKDARVEIRTLLEDVNGVIRDPDVSADGRRILFAWKKSDRLDDYHLYEMEVATGKVRQLTFGLGAADYEGIYLPDGDIVFNSTRCVQTVDCYWTEVSNLYRCDGDGRRLRRLAFDQVHDNYPQLLDDGRIVYTRWEYNDRGQIFPQPLFQMNPDGTNQTEYYGNNSYFPTSILHARGLPGSGQVVAIASGHHSSQAGKLIVIDPSRGRQEATGVQLIAPERKTEAVKVDAYGQSGELWMYPYPLSPRAFLVTYLPEPGRPAHDRFSGRFGVYWMDRAGRRELLASSPTVSCCQAIPLQPRIVPVRPTTVDYRKSEGVFYLHDVYQGPGLAGVPRGTIKSLRVVALDFRVAGIGNNMNSHALISTPTAIGGGAWDPKVVLGTTPVYDDGSAMFVVPARTPVYFQALDAQGHMVQTMRSWSTLQPGETASCIGCHEDKNQSAPDYIARSRAMREGSKPLEQFDDAPRGFSFSRQVQPIFDRHCVACHRDRSRVLAGDQQPAPAPATASVSKDEKPLAFSLLGETNLDRRAKRWWSDSYLVLTGAYPSAVDKSLTADWDKPLVNWPGAQTMPPMLPAYSFGAAKSRLIKLLDEGHYDVKLSPSERHRLSCWIDLAVPYCGDYREANAWTPQEMATYDRFTAKRQRFAAFEGRGVAAFLAGRAADHASATTAAIAEMAIVAEWRDVDGKSVWKFSGRATPDRPLALELPKARQAGDRLRVTVPAKYLAVSRADRSLESLLYAPKGEFDMVPAAVSLRLRPVAARELDAYRDLSRTDFARSEDVDVFPRVARTATGEHNDWLIEFGRPIQFDKVIVTLRAGQDDPSQRHLFSIRLSGADREDVSLRHVAAPQAFVFKPRKTSQLRLIDLTDAGMPAGPRIEAVEVFGRDDVPIGHDLDATANDAF